MTTAQVILFSLWVARSRSTAAQVAKDEGDPVLFPFDVPAETALLPGLLSPSCVYHMRLPKLSSAEPPDVWPITR